MSLLCACWGERERVRQTDRDRVYDAFFLLSTIAATGLHSPSFLAFISWLHPPWLTITSRTLHSFFSNPTHSSCSLTRPYHISSFSSKRLCSLLSTIIHCHHSLLFLISLQRLFHYTTSVALIFFWYLFVEISSLVMT